MRRRWRRLLRRRRSGGPRRGALALLAGALVGALVGIWCAGRFGAAFSAPAPAPDHWTVLVPGRQAGVADASGGRSTRLQGGALVLGRYAFDRADRLVPAEREALRSIEVELAADSEGALEIVFVGDRGEGGAAAVCVKPEGYRLRECSQDGAPLDVVWTEREPGPFQIRATGGQLMYDAPFGGVVRSPTVELTSVGGEVRIARIQIVGEDGAALVDADYREVSEAGPRIGGALLGALIGIALVGAAWPTAMGGAALAPGPALAGAAAGLILPALVLGVGQPAWLAWVERLYLPETSWWALSRGCLIASLVPLLGLAALRSGRLRIPVGAGVSDRARERTVSRAWLAAWTAASLFASRELLMPLELAALPLGIAAALWPARLVRASGMDRRRAALLDLPALAIFLAWGWPALAAVMLWRLLLLAATARTLLTAAPRPAADLLLIYGLGLLPALEAGARTSQRGLWSMERLEGGARWQDAEPFWSASCGEGRPVRLVFGGGSATGGAYQFRDTPEAFFPARVHEALCAQRPDGIELITENHGNSGYNTFTFSRSLDALRDRGAPIGMIVLYVGVNDWLERQSARTRAEREASREALLAPLVQSSRLLTGLTLAAAPLVDETGERVPEVPLEDAEQNLRAIAAGADAPVLLSAQHVAPGARALLEPYWEMERGLAAELPRVQWIDPRAEMEAWRGAPLLVDRNHMSAEGNQRLADILTPEIAARLW